MLKASTPFLELLSRFFRDPVGMIDSGQNSGQNGDKKDNLRMIEWTLLKKIRINNESLRVKCDCLP